MFTFLYLVGLLQSLIVFKGIIEEMQSFAKMTAKDVRTNAGNIILDGVAIENYDVISQRQQVSSAFQDFG